MAASWLILWALGRGISRYSQRDQGVRRAGDVKVHPEAKQGSSAAAESEHRDHREQLVRTMQDFVRQNYRDPIGLEDLARAMRMNASYVSALFSQTAGVTFHEFLKEIRLVQAKTLLSDPRNRVSEVACAAGYASADAFRHAFKASEGVSPQKWRTRPQGPKSSPVF